MDNQKTIKYKLYYKLNNEPWKFFYYNAKDDEEAKQYVKNWTGNKVYDYYVIKETSERLVIE